MQVETIISERAGIMENDQQAVIHVARGQVATVLPKSAERPMPQQTAKFARLAALRAH
jgi:hypothetical protein